MIIVAMIANVAPLPASSPPFEGAVRLPDWGVIRAHGADATTFLQGQLTNDLAGLPAGRACLAGYCSPKGRLLASLIVWRAEDGDWLLACSADLLASTLKRLSMFVMRAHCKLSDASLDIGLWGLAGEAARRWAGAPVTAPWQVGGWAGVQMVRLDDVGAVPRWLVAAPASQAPFDLPALPLDAWRSLEVRSGVARIVAATVDAFVPQMVNFELVGGVSFKKGCYPGQEVVARSQYRGTLKRRAALLTGATEMIPGQELFHVGDAGQPAGQVVLAAPAEAGSWVALAEVKLSALDGQPLHLGSVTGPLLTVGALPYAVPADVS